MIDRQHLSGHLTMFFACAMWGLSAPVGKIVMNGGMNGLQLVSLRIAGATVCFWIASLFVRHERMARRDLLRLLAAGLLAIGVNQTLFTVGLSYTSPINASIMTTMMPIFTMFLAFLFLREPITWKKVTGILLGASGAILIVLASTGDTTHLGGNAKGDLLILCAQLCFATYLTAFKDVIHRYSGITCMKWMFLSSLVFVVPFTSQSFASFDWTAFDMELWGYTAYVVLGATFLAYLLLMYAQKILRPTVVSIYNYVQPLVAATVSILAGIAQPGWAQLLAVILVFGGVWLVTQSKSRAQLLEEQMMKQSRTT